MAQDQDNIDSVMNHINMYSLKIESGEVYDGVVVKIMDFGAFVKLSPNKDGLVHISEIKKERVEKVSDHLKEGDTVTVKVLRIENGKISLSMKALL